MGIHLRYGGSSAHRTLACPGWIKKSENLPKRPAGDAAIEGSMHHEVQERCQRDGVKPGSLIGLIYKEPGTDITREFTDDDLTLSEIAYNATNKLLDELDIDEMMVEPFVQYIEGVAGGSIDLLGLSADRKTLLVLDLKFGRIAVDVVESAQHALYTVSAGADPSTKDMVEDVERIVFAIVQPRVEGVVSTWECDWGYIEDFLITLHKAMDQDHLVAGTHCNYCPAEAFCETKRLNIMAANLLDAADQAELAKAAAMVKEVEGWLRDIKEEMYLQMSRGVPVPGWKIVAKKATRKWIDEDEAAAAIKLPKKYKYKTTLLTPAQMETVVKKKKVKIDLDEFITASSSGDTIATVDDPRDAVIVSDVTGHLDTMMK